VVNPDEGGKIMKCCKCDSENLIIVDSGPHKKLVCCDCNAFQKFLSKKDATTFEQIQKKKNLNTDLTEPRDCIACLHGYMEMMGLCSNPVKYFARIEDERGKTGNCGPAGTLWQRKTQNIQSSHGVGKQGCHANYR
jgi:hypothetical protein